MISAKELKELATKEMIAYIDMGHFRYPDEAKPYLIDGYMQGYRAAEKDAEGLVEALKWINELDNDPSNHHKDVTKCAICKAKQTLSKWRERGV